MAWPSLTPQQQTEIVGLYENTSEGFSVVLPDGWVGQENEDNFPLLSILGGEEDAEGDSPVRGQVWVIPRGDDSPAQAWLEGQLAGSAVVRSEPRSYADAESAHQLFTNRPTESGEALVDLWTAVARGSQMFLLRVQTGEPDWATYETEANAFTDSFALQAPMPFGTSRDDSLFQYWGEILTLDPALSRSGAGDILGGIFSGLVKLDTDLQVVADMAESWEVSDNNTVFTFTLRDNARFHDGRAVMAADVKYSWERALHPDLESPVAHTYLGDIVGAQAMVDGEAETLEGVEVLDDRTLRVTITDPFSYFLSKLTYPTSFVVDRANVEIGEDWTDAPNGTGAFKLKVWEKDRFLILESNEDWYGGAPALAHVVYRIFAGNPMQMYENGEIDLTGIYVNNIDRARDPANDLNDDLIEGTELCTFYLGFNASQPPFDDPKVRQALALALEIDKELEVTRKGLAARAAGFVPPGMFAYNETLEPSTFDLEAARQLLGESWYGGAENLPPIESFADDDAIHWAWREHLGLEVEAVSVFGFADFLERLDNEEFGVLTAGWCADYPDPQNFLDVLFHSDSAENRFGYANEQVDALLEEASVEPDPTRRASLYQEAEQLILDDWVAVPLRHSNSYMLVRPYVKGFELTPIGVPQLQNISIEREQ
jgi:ABC-type transport system substrate-binding protein